VNPRDCFFICAPLTEPSLIVYLAGCGSKQQFPKFKICDAAVIK